MTSILKGLILISATLVSALAYANSGHAHRGQHHAQPTPGDAATAAVPEGVSVEDCWIRALPNRLPAAAYFRIVNAGATDIALIGAQAEGFDKVMLHTHQEVNGMMAMVHAARVDVPAGGSFSFVPGGHHVMLEQHTAELKIGTQRAITLWFEGGRALTVNCAVRPPNAMK